MPRATAPATLLLVLALTPSPAVASLTLNDAVKTHPGVIVYELPDPAGRDAAITFARGLIKDINPKAELLDAAATPDLPDRLSHGFVLATTLGEQSKLLHQITGRMGWTLDSGNFRWHGISTPAASAFLIITAKNPFGDGLCVVIAGGNNAALIGAHNIDGSASAYLFNGTRLQREFRYDADFVTHTDLSKAEALADIDQFFSTLERAHVNLLAKVTPESYAKLRQRTVDAVTAKLNPQGRLTFDDLAWELYYAAAFFQDGHTSVQYFPDLSASTDRRYPAFHLTAVNGHLFIAGAELLAVNGTPIAEFLKPILDRNSGETLIFRTSRFLAMEPVWWYLSNLFGSAPSYRIKVRDAAGAERETPLETLTFADYRRLLKSAAEPENNSTRVEFLDSGAVAHFIYPAFQRNDAEKHRIDQIFLDIRNKGARDLIIDIRGNGGGNSEMGDYIFSYLYDRPFYVFSKIEVKEQQGKIHLMQAKERALPKPDAFFSGRTYLLIDNGTFSSASAFAAMFRDYQIGTVLGYETGGIPTSFGDTYAFRLTNSGIPCASSFKRFSNPKPRPGDDQHGVLPNVPFDATHEGLDYTLEVIRKRRSKASN